MLTVPSSITLILVLFALGACSTAPAPLSSFEPASATESLTARNAKSLGWLTVGGQPNEADLAAVAQAGTGCVINMRTAEEMSGVEFDEKAAVETLGMRYLHLPVSGVDSLTDEFFEAAREGLRKCRGNGALMH